MGGGGDSRIPSILREALREKGISVVVRTYSFDPEAASRQIDSWVEEFRPALVVGESLGAVHAIRIKGVPHILISPALNAPLYFSFLAWAALIPGATACLNRIYMPEEGDRQKPHFTFRILRKYGVHRREALANSTRSGSDEYFHAFIGLHDHYMKSGIVSIRTWEKHFGDSYSTYEGSHFTEEEHIYSIIIPKIGSPVKVCVLCIDILQSEEEVFHI